ncbi:kinase subdomain-containing [Pyrenophora seminiperda CCB06]|uniref:Kinase subdomain-containing n=1 Tax=Pyrenophora seminiperda CCB06 TaxID=1302712 RepID=A0A3M7M5R1_9PLEO|nr:kinase subdomain-containing [Pyrenophora seminiperda CCB06]
MAPSATKTKAHTLHFSYDDEDNSALTTLINDVRFHITVRSSELQKSREKPLYYEYLDKISALREAEEREEDPSEELRSKIRNHKKDSKGREGSAGKDSGVDVSGDDDEYVEVEEAGEDEDQDSASAGVELRNWILAGLADITKESAPPNREPEVSTLYEWYHGPTYFYDMQIANGELSPTLIETTPELEGKIEDLVPRMKIPKYMQDYKLPWYNANDLTVQSEVSQPPPAHPGQVLHQETGDVFFFKPVVSEQPDSVKREIQILRKLEKLDVDIKFPHLLGFVAMGNSKTEAMGLLLENIESPTPLTKLLRSSVDEEKRAEWSRKSSQYVKALHDHDIIWGDAKADNFMVDADSELWIIDFGGSYTEGWVDPEISETLEGDEMGLEKIQAALEDPDRNTVDLGLVVDEEDENEDEGHESTGLKETASTLFVTERSVGEEVTKSEKRKRAVDEVEADICEDDDSKPAHKKEKRDNISEESMGSKSRTSSTLA